MQDWVSFVILLTVLVLPVLRISGIMSLHIELKSLILLYWIFHDINSILNQAYSAYSDFLIYIHSVFDFRL